MVARTRSKNKQHRQQSNSSFSAAVHNAHGAVNGVEAAPCQPSAAYGCMTLPAIAESHVGTPLPNRLCAWLDSFRCGVRQPMYHVALFLLGDVDDYGFLPGIVRVRTLCRGPKTDLQISPRRTLRRGTESPVCVYLLYTYLPLVFKHKLQK